MNTSECEHVLNCELIEQTAFESLVKKSITANINHIWKDALKEYCFIKLFGKTIGMFVFGVDIYDEYNVKQNQKGKYGNFLYWIILRKIKLKTNIQPHKIKLCFNDENNIFRAIKILSLIFFAVSLYSRNF
ncbi:hypothetical protein H0R92_07440 [Treponema sp. OMZ 840]|uniref:hypothetical protein n=1 Tax=Treponema sp. OMZ 840 TaxID=244313 RepID=UPI003D8D63BA